jgi:hypothetical protein
MSVAETGGDRRARSGLQTPSYIDEAGWKPAEVGGRVRS